MFEQAEAACGPDGLTTPVDHGACATDEGTALSYTGKTVQRVGDSRDVLMRDEAGHNGKRRKQPPGKRLRQAREAGQVGSDHGVGDRERVDGMPPGVPGPAKSMHEQRRFTGPGDRVVDGAARQVDAARSVFGDAADGQGANRVS